MSAFSNMMKSMNSDLDRLQKTIENMKSGKKESYDDPRFWTLERDKAGNGSALIRFLPAPVNEKDPAVKFKKHHFQGKGGWLVENCPKSLGLPCPVCESNNELYSEADGNKNHPSFKIAGDRKAKTFYVSNILIVSDPANPDNNGKVFLYKYGPQVFEKIVEVMSSQDPDEPSFNPFHPKEGANFKLRAAMESGYVSYKSSKFAAQSPMCEGDMAKAEAAWKSAYPLAEFVDPKNYKSYDELKQRLDRVLNSSGASQKAEASEPSDFRSKMTNEDIDDEIDKRFGKAPAKKDDDAPFTPTKATAPKAKPPAKSDDDEEEDAMSYFRKLAEDE